MYARDGVVTVRENPSTISSLVLLLVLISRLPTNELRVAIYECLIPLFHTGSESHELQRIDKYLDSWQTRSQFVKILTDSHSP